MIGVIIFAAGLSGFTPMAVVQIGAVVFGFGLSWLGVRLWSKTASNYNGCLLPEAMS
jgi:Na+/phosphate symporter